MYSGLRHAARITAAMVLIVLCALACSKHGRSDRVRLEDLVGQDDAATHALPMYADPFLAKVPELPTDWPAEILIPAGAFVGNNGRVQDRSSAYTLYLLFEADPAAVAAKINGGLGTNSNYELTAVPRTMLVSGLDVEAFNWVGNEAAPYQLIKTNFYSGSSLDGWTFVSIDLIKRQ